MQELEKKIKRLEKRLDRERRAREILEKEIEKKTRDLFLSYEYSSLLLNSIDNLILIVNEDLEVVDSNKSWDNVEGVEGRSFSSLFKLVKGRDALEKKILEEERYSDELTLIVGKKEIPVYVSGRFIEVQNKRKMIFTFTDLTEKNEIQAEQKKLQEKLIKSAYSDGLAESAISVLHNIGNVLTSLTSLISEKTELKELEKTSKLIHTLNGRWNDLENEKRKQVIEASSDSLSISIEQISSLYSFVSEKCSHISNIIASQQRYANLKENIRIKTSLVEVINDCISMVGDKAKKRNIQVTLDDSFEGLVMAEKVGLAQVVLNIFVNAVESIDEKLKQREASEERIDISFKETENNIVMVIQDSGMGISKENLESLFQFGFSTKERGSGFGLHNCSNYMVNNGGKISIESDGELQGAKVLLEFEKAS